MVPDLVPLGARNWCRVPDVVVVVRGKLDIGRHVYLGPLVPVLSLSRCDLAIGTRTGLGPSPLLDVGGCLLRSLPGRRVL